MHKSGKTFDFFSANIGVSIKSQRKTQTANHKYRLERKEKMKMVWEELKTSLIVTDMKAASSREVFEQLGGLLTKEGYTKESYVQALINREKDFPTGLNIDGVGVAIPHTDVSHVNKAATAIATLKDPVDWIEMGTDDDPVGAKVVFMLAVDDPQGHLNQLQQIIGIIQDKEVLNRIIEEKDPEKIIEIIREKESTM